MKNKLRSAVCTEGRRMAGARALWVAAGMKHEQFGKPIIAIVNSFTQFVPGHTHLHDIGQIVKEEIEKMGCYAAEFNTIAIDDGIAMGHDGMLYSLPSRDIIADSVEYMVNAHKADAMICISNCDKVTPGMLMAAMRLNIPTVFCSGGPMEAGRWKGANADLITAMVNGADKSVSDEELKEIESCACPGCGSCSGMFTANSMNSLTEAIGMSLPGNGTILATHKNRIKLFKDAAHLIVENAMKYYEDGDDSVLPRNIATREAFLNAMTLDIAMGGSTNTVLHLLAVAQEGGVEFTMSDIDRLSRKVPCLCKLSPNTQKYSIQECNRAGGIFGILNELAKGGLIHKGVKRADGKTLGEQLEKRYHESCSRRRGGQDIPQRSRKKVLYQDGITRRKMGDARHRPQRGLHTRPRPRLYERRWTCRAVRKHRTGRMRGEDCRSGPCIVALRRTGKGIRFPGGCLRGNPWRKGEERGLRGDNPRRTEGRSGNAGDALPHFVYQEHAHG